MRVQEENQVAWRFYVDWQATWRQLYGCKEWVFRKKTRLPEGCMWLEKLPATALLLIGMRVQDESQVAWRLYVDWQATWPQLYSWKKWVFRMSTRLPKGCIWIDKLPDHSSKVERKESYVWEPGCLKVVFGLTSYLTTAL